MASSVRQQMRLPFFVIVPIGYDGRFGAPVFLGHCERWLGPARGLKAGRLIEIQPAQMGLAGVRLTCETDAELVAECHAKYDEPPIMFY